MSNQFEFSDRLLTFLAEEVYSYKYGNFLFNCEYDRLQMKVSERTLNIWSIIEKCKDKEFKNPNFVGHFEGQM